MNQQEIEMMKHITRIVANEMIDITAETVKTAADHSLPPKCTANAVLAGLAGGFTASCKMIGSGVRMVGELRGGPDEADKLEGMFKNGVKQQLSNIARDFGFELGFCFDEKDQG